MVEHLRITVEEKAYDVFVEDVTGRSVQGTKGRPRYSHA